MRQLGRGLALSPQGLRSHKALQIKRLVPREQVIHGAAQLMREDGQGFGLTVFVFKCGKGCLPRLTLTNEEHGGFGKGPTQMDIANLSAGGSQPLPPRLFGTLH